MTAWPATTEYAGSSAHLTELLAAIAAGQQDAGGPLAAVARLNGPFPHGIAGGLPGKGHRGAVVRHREILRLSGRSGAAPRHGRGNGHGGVQFVQVALDAPGVPHDGLDAPEALPRRVAGQGAGVVDLRGDFRGGAARVFAAHDARRGDAGPDRAARVLDPALIHISEPTGRTPRS